jgi:hypothetical protein
MSLIKANAVQIGQSGTATDNFTLAVPSSPNGTIKLARGNSGATTQDVMNISNTGVVSFPQGFSTGNITTNVTGNLTGDVFASNGTSKVLENGTNGTNATFTGSVSGGTLSGNASSATALATGSTTARSLDNRFADILNVKDFGAVGNGSPSDIAAIQTAMAYAISTGNKIIFPFSVTIRIPTDAPDLQSALNAISDLTSVPIIINIESGHILTSGFRITNRDCSFIKINSSDPFVNVSPTMTLVSNSDLSSDIPRSTLIAFLGVRSKMPTWNILVDMSAVSCVSGYELDYASDGVVLPTKGVKNTSFSGLPINGCNCRITSNSRLQAALTIWTGAKAGNVAVSLNAFANFQNADLSDTDNEACLDVSRGSIVHALQANVSNGSYAGVYVRRSFLSCQQINLSNCVLGIWASSGSHVAAVDATFDGCTQDVKCEGGSIIGLNRALKSGVNLNPQNSVVQNATSGTSVARAFNISGGYGLIAYANNLPGNAEYLTSGSTVNITSLSLQSIASLAYATAATFTGEKRLIYGGTIYGPDIGIRITIDGVVVMNDGARVLGNDSANNTLSVIQIPPCKCEQSILIEAHNRSSLPTNIGWRIYHSQAL